MMQLADRISGALAAYETGNLAGALAILENVGDAGPVTDADVGLHMARATASPRHAAVHWIDVAKQRIRRELGAILVT